MNGMDALFLLMGTMVLALVAMPFLWKTKVS